MKLSPAEIEARLEEIRLSYIASLRDKHDVIVASWSTLCSHWDPETFHTLYRLLHSLAGSAETFGLEAISRDAQQLVEQFRPHDGREALSPEILPVVQGTLEHLCADMQIRLAELEKT